LTLSRYDNLGNMLSRKTSQAIREYAYNGLNTISIRGTSPRHTGIFWNGVQLNPVNTGLMDLSLIPVGFFSDIHVINGGANTVNGENSIGGSIHLGNEPAFTTQGSGSGGIKAGSYSDYSGFGHVLLSSKKWHSKTSVMLRKAENDFYFRSLMNEEVRLENASLQQFGFMQDLFVKVGKSTIAGGSVWVQDNYKEIPATITSKPSDAFQNDHALRTLLSVKHYFKRSDFSLKGAYFSDRLHYKDPDTVHDLQIDSEIETARYTLLGDYNQKINQNIALTSGFNLALNRGISLNYIEKSRQDQWGLFFMFSQDIPAIQWKYNIILRQDFVLNDAAPFTPSLATEIVLVRNISARGSLSRNFKAPTFNDLYWIPGGNPDLKAEYGWSEDIGIIYNHAAKGKINLKAEISAFSLQVNDWIVWVPDATFWKPQNIQQVWSRGFETDVKIKTILGKSEVRFSGGYTYTRSTNEKSTSDNDQSLRKQLIYVPLHRFFLDLIYNRNGLIVNPTLNYNGFRYITTDNLYRLPAYGLIDLTISRSFAIKVYSINLRFDIHNVFNTEYQAVQYYPMPGRHYSIILQCSIN
ncbi:MAG: TonB-dependent receptor plug domain-containing protein, partial [Bacteroidales bacterium]